MAKETDRDLEKEIAALIQVVNGLNEVYDDDAKFERVYKYIEMRYKDKVAEQRDKLRNTLLIYALDQQERLEATLREIRSIAESGALEPGRITELIDKCFFDVKKIGDSDVSDLNAYKEKKRTA